MKPKYCIQCGKDYYPHDIPNGKSRFCKNCGALLYSNGASLPQNHVHEITEAIYPNEPNIAPQTNRSKWILGISIIMIVLLIISGIYWLSVNQKNKYEKIATEATTDSVTDTGTIIYGSTISTGNEITNTDMTEVSTANLDEDMNEDRDGDGFFDADDKCPDEAGAINGCPQADGNQAQTVFNSNFVHFEAGKSVILTTSYKTLDKVVEVLKTYSYYDVQIAGHTDNIGTPEDNQRLSESRANAVFKYLTSKGIPAIRMSTIGFGQTKPIAENQSQEGRVWNNRVELNLILKN